MSALVLKDDGETWPLAVKLVASVGDRAKGGWFYACAYTQKDAPFDHCRTFHVGVDAAGAKALGVDCLNDIWAECLAIFEKHAEDPKGVAGKRMWATLAAQIAGRSHGAVEVIEKNDGPHKLLKFAVQHDLAWLNLDPVTLIALMLASGAYALGSSWIASAHGGKLDVTRFGCLLRIMANGRLATCRPLLNQALFGQFADTESIHVHMRGRSALLPPMAALQRMTLDELKKLASNGLQVPARLQHMGDHAARPHAPSAVVVDLAAGLAPRLVDEAAGSLAALEPRRSAH